MSAPRALIVSGRPSARGDQRGGGSVGKEELRVDEVERLFGMQPPGQRQHRARRSGAGSTAPPILGISVKRGWWTVSPPSFDVGADRRQLRVALVQRQRPGRHAERIDHRPVDVAARRDAPASAGHERPERGAGRVGKQRAEREDAQHAPQSFRTSISATASHGGLSITIWRWPGPGGSSATRLPSRSIIRPKAKRPPGRGARTSRLSRRA